MTSFLSLFSFAHLKSELSRIVKRFPFSVLLILGVSGVFTYLNAQWNDIDENISRILGNVIVTSIVTFCLVTAAVLSFEKMNLRRWIKILIGIGFLAFGIVFYLALGDDPFNSMEGATLIFLTFFGFFAFLFFAPFAADLRGKGYRENAYVKYFYALATVFLMSAIIGGALMALGSIALWSIDTLFDVTWISDKAYGYWAIFALSLTAPLFWLVRIPTSEDIALAKGNENPFFTFLVKYVGLPFISLYFLILYAYSVKVLLNFQDWPKWQISWMVIGFSVFGYIIYIFSQVIGESESIIQRVRRYFPYAVIPQVLMLFYAIYLRIAQYDITMNRYFVVVFGIWLLGISLYYGFSREKRLAFIPATLAVIVFIISIGPWSVYSLPFHRQYDRLLVDLQSAKILSGNVIVPLEKYEAIDPTLSNDIYEGIGYVCRFDDCQPIRTLFTHEIAAAEAEKLKKWQASEEKYQKCIADKKENCYRDEYYKDLQSYEIQSTISEKIKVRNFPYNGNSAIPQIFYFGLDSSKNDVFPLDIVGYDTVIRIVGKDTYSNQWDNIMKFDTNTLKWELILSGQVAEVFGLDDMNKYFLALHTNTPQWDTINPTKDEMTFLLEGQQYSVKVILQSINIPNPEYKGNDSFSTKYSYTEGYALLRKK